MPVGAARPVHHYFTVDVEEHFHANALEPVVKRSEWDQLPSRVERNVDVLLDMLDRHRATGTFFVVGWLASRHPELLRLISDAGHEIASHGFWHRRVTSASLNDFRTDVRDAKAAIEDVVGMPVVGYRAPSFSIRPGGEEAFDVLLEEGYEYDSSIFPIRRAGYGYPGAPTHPFVIDREAGALREYPLTTLDVLGVRVPAAGGGYLRQFPFGLIERAFAERERRGVPAVFYIHPWEIDPGQPRLPVRALTRLRHYRGLDVAQERVERLLQRFSFTSISAANASEAAR
ncbi:MAG: DUF3473 domain-containing protein [Gemmatimonadaceae bacterium]|nr:DUF3473 domain-containing protein [Gemmatimonadaceae bacterium]NUQ92156.1 DUF3473 domain-containing protein [Gemmatimonadaceae bacterium]NUR18272.1 DUF3473 domain-containing protein [Gemmatimonadaceae bacterium]NUS96104.1 DUF3473 domain-containing protein [Gemmatimonadaceae bacterium]